MYINSFCCSTAAGPSAFHLWQQLAHPEFTAQNSHDFFGLKELPNYPIFSATPAKQTARERGHFLLRQAIDSDTTHLQTGLKRKARLGLLLASTKGYFENSGDPKEIFSPLLQDCSALLQIRPDRTLIVAQACSSALVACQIAKEWLTAQLVDHCLVVALDLVSPFVLRGFHSLRALSTELPRPFDKIRSGLVLGEAAALIRLSLDEESPYRLTGFGLNVSGSGATRPDEDGLALSKALDQACENSPAPNLIVAHGTATSLNDKTEALAIQNLFPNTAVTAHKWRVGHSLGASFAIDLIAGIGMLKDQCINAIATLQEPEFQLNLSNQLRRQSQSRLLISSLGFGGTHAGALLEKL